MKNMKLIAFKGDEEEIVEIETDEINTNVRFKGKDYIFDFGITSNCNLLLIEEKLDGFKFRTCINCRYYHGFCIEGNILQGKLYCMPRLMLSSKIENERLEGIGSGLFEKDSDKDKEMRNRFALIEGGEKFKRFLKPSDTCSNFIYMNPSEKHEMNIKGVEEGTNDYRKMVESEIGDEERWYWEDKK